MPPQASLHRFASYIDISTNGWYRLLYEIVGYTNQCESELTKKTTSDLDPNTKFHGKSGSDFRSETWSQKSRWSLRSLYIQFRHFMLRTSSKRCAGIATRYGLDDPGIESRWGARFSAPVQTGPGAQPASYTTGAGSFPGGKATTHPHLVPRLRKEYSYNSTPPLSIRGLFWVDLYLCLCK